MADPRKIITEFVNPPIPPRQFDWAAYFDGDEPNDNGQMRHGSGRTEYDAVKDLIENYDDAHFLHGQAIQVFELFWIFAPKSSYLTGSINTVTALLGVTFESGVLAGINQMSEAVLAKVDEHLPEARS